MYKFYEYFQKVTVPLGYAMAVVGLVFLFQWDSIVKLWVFLFVCIVTILIAGILSYIDISQERKKHNYIADNTSIAQSLKDAMEIWYSDEKYGEVITFGKALGRALYISACYQTRIEVGELVKNAAEHRNDKILTVKVLLDDLGWTKFLCGDISAKDDINAAIEIATDIKYYWGICKGYRHLLAIEISIWNNPNEAHELLKKAYSAYDKIDAGREKEIVLAGLIYAEAELAFKEHDYALARNKAIESQKKRNELNETDRNMRCYAQLGKIELIDPQGEIEKAKDYFRKGIDESERIDRVDEIVKNTYGYAICLIRTGNRKKAKKIVDEMQKLYGEVPLYTEDELLRKEYETASNH